MGYWKSVALDEQEQGWRFIDKHACRDCLAEEALQELVQENAEEKACDYCGAKSEEPIAASVNVLMEAIADALRSEYGDPDNEGVPYDTSEGGYQLPTMDTREVLEEVGDPFENDNLRDDVLSAFDADWCQKNVWQLPKAEALQFGWKHFCDLVKYRARYVFLIGPEGPQKFEDPDHISPAQFLLELAKIVTDAGLVKNHPAASGWWRARWFKPGTKASLPQDLAPPPMMSAKNANRMSPAGIPMFYGSIDKITAETEAKGSDPKKSDVLSGKFLTARDFKVLDLREIPPVPSIFDASRRHLRSGLKFLRHFVHDLSQPIEKNDREHIEYVPTQIVTEYFRHVFRTPNGEVVQGILFNSARESGGENCVFFFQNDECCMIEPGWEKKLGGYTRDKPAYWLGIEIASVERRETAKKRPSKRHAPAFPGLREKKSKRAAKRRS